MSTYLPLDKTKKYEGADNALLCKPTHSTIEGNLSGYDKKKYVCKLLYMYILGWDIDFGHMEAVNLISSPKYSEKQIVSWVCEGSRVRESLFSGTEHSKSNTNKAHSLYLFLFHHGRRATWESRY